MTEAFAISNGVKKGYVLAPVLFNILFTCMLSHAVRDLEKGVYICYRLDDSLFDLRRLAAKTKSLQSLHQEVLFADDCALVAHTESDLQLMLDRFSSASKLFGLTVSLGKTKVLHQPAPNTHPRHPTQSLITHHMAMLIISYILEAPFPAMTPWTKKSSKESARQARRWANSATECSTNTTSGY